MPRWHFYQFDFWERPVKWKYRPAVALALTGAALLVLLRPQFALAQQTVPHLEACTKWDFYKGKKGFQNDCGQPVVVLFMQLNTQRVVERTVNPGARFDTGLTEKNLQGWMSTRCPVGYDPSVPFKVENSQAIIGSQYECVKK
jgi:hypothetical protein